MKDEIEELSERKFCSNKGVLYRYFAAVNISLIGIGFFVAFDCPGALQEALLNRFDIDFSEFALIYSLNSWPNVVLSFIGGVLIDRVFGLKMATVIYVLIIVVGHYMFSFGVYINAFWFALLGRFITGIGFEVVYLCLQLQVIKYFIGKELGMVLCVIVSVSRLGSSLAYAISGPILHYVKERVPGEENVGIVLFIVGGFLSLSIFGASVLACMEPETSQIKLNVKKKIKLSCDWRDYFYFPIEFWLLLVIQISYFVMIYEFLPYSQEFFKTVNGMTLEEANRVTSFFSLIGIVIAPLVGFIVDKIGRGQFFTQLGLLLGLATHVMLGFSTWSPYIGIFFLSLAYAFFNGAYRPMMAYIIPEHRLGTAYGVGSAALNLIYASSVYLAGTILDIYSYVGLEIFFIVFVIIGLTGSTTLWVLNHRRNGILNLAPSQRLIFLTKAKETEESKEPLRNANSEFDT